MATEPRSGIYAIVNTINGKRYVGSAVAIKARWRVHRHQLGRGVHHSAPLQRAWKKYGPESFRFEVLEVCSVSDLIAREQAAFDRLSPEYNLAPIAGSSFGCKRSDSFKAAIRAAQLGRKASIETRAAMSAAHRGRPKDPLSVQKSAAARRGKPQGPLSDEHKAKISEALTGRKQSAEHSAAISAGKLGCRRPDMVGNDWGRRKHTDEERAANSARQLGRPKSEETKLRMKLAWERRKATRS
ncbi:NUMOD3 domain-containing DNA-binding protein [Brevundimonas sp.]|uniref:NUMOD3 domain-containing DNA-binding protein n=1 Tax=Brevundimonas sp. TaxID=1871086 RepID=UPI0028A712FE|nr:NUMOD3 domain-containing DNA-binding protein [Brevundimonas sp.]